MLYASAASRASRAAASLISGTSREILGVDVPDDLGLGEAEQIVVALQFPGPIGEALAAILSFVELMPLNHGAHGTVQQQDAFPQQGLKACLFIHSG